MSSNGAARGGGRQSGRTMSDSDSQDKRRIGFGRSSLQPAASSQPRGPEAGSGCQLTRRTPRSKQPELAAQARGLGADEAELASLMGAMDNDLDRPEPLSSDALQEQNLQAAHSKGTETSEGSDQMVLYCYSFIYTELSSLHSALTVL